MVSPSSRSMKCHKESHFDQHHRSSKRLAGKWTVENARKKYIRALKDKCNNHSPPSFRTEKGEIDIVSRRNSASGAYVRSQPWLEKTIEAGKVKEELRGSCSSRGEPSPSLSSFNSTVSFFSFLPTIEAPLIAEGKFLVGEV